MLIPVVNEDDEIIDYKERSSLWKEDIYRVSAAIIKNKKWEILIAQRGLQKKNNPWQWTVSVAGTVEKDETYDDNIKKEIKEELWLQKVEIKLLGKKKIQKSTSYFCQVYVWYISWDEEITIEYPEVNDIKWVTRETLEMFQQEANVSNTLFEFIKDFNLFE